MRYGPPGSVTTPSMKVVKSGTFSYIAYFANNIHPLRKEQNCLTKWGAILWLKSQRRKWQRDQNRNYSTVWEDW
jgi:hypothetical protein